MTRTYDECVAEALDVAEHGAAVVADRCDRCGGRGEATVQLRTGALTFCTRCFKKHSAALAGVVKVPSSL